MLFLMYIYGIFGGCLLNCCSDCFYLYRREDELAKGKDYSEQVLPQSKLRHGLDQSGFPTGLSAGTINVDCSAFK